MKLLLKWLIKIGTCARDIFGRYRPIIKHIYATNGPRAAARYVWCKFFLRGERNGTGILDPFIYFWPDTVKEPYMYEGELTTLCSLRCAVCERTYWPTDKKAWALPYDKPDAPIDFLRFLDSMPKMRYFNPTGIGETFLNPEWPKMLAELTRRGIYVNIVDNFAHRTDEQIRSLVDQGVQRVYISLDGATKETYEAMRPGAKWERTIDNIRKLQEYRRWKGSPLPEICYKYIICDTTQNEIPQFIDLVGGPLRTTPEYGDDNLVEFLGMMEFPEIAGREVDTADDTVVAANSLGKAYGIKVMWAHHQHGSRKDMRGCVVWQEPFIIEGRHVLPCCAVLVRNDRERLYRCAMGDLAKNTFKEIWDSPRYKRFRRQFNDKTLALDPICEDCRVFNTKTREHTDGIYHIG